MEYSSDFDSACSTPYVSAPSSPGRSSSATPTTGAGNFFYSAPASPMHFILSSSSSATSSSSLPSEKSSAAAAASISNSEFEFSSRFPAVGSSTCLISSADELFLNGQIRPMKLSSHLQRPQLLAPLLDDDETETESVPRGGREVKWRDRSLRRRTRSMSPLRTDSSPFKYWSDTDEEANLGSKNPEEVISNIEENSKGEEEENENVSGSTSRSSSSGRSSKRWVFLKEFLYRSKSEGRNHNKFWNNFSFSPVKDKRKLDGFTKKPEEKLEDVSTNNNSTESTKKVKPTNGVGKRRVPSASPHEKHYKANRAQAEEMRKKTALPYRQGLIGCLGFSSKSYGAVNGLARALNPVSSR